MATYPSGRRFQRRLLGGWAAEADARSAIREGVAMTTALITRSTKSPERPWSTSVIQERSITQSLIVVPDLNAVDLTALVKRDRALTYLDSDVAAWDYYRGDKGQSIPGRGWQFEALVWEPQLGSSEIIPPETVRAYFRKHGYFGHTGAFIQWRHVVDLEGYHASIPDDYACWCRSTSVLYAPYSYYDEDEDIRELAKYPLAYEWDDRWSFVGFRQLVLS